MANIRNPRYASTSTNVIDVEIEHPEYGWIPYTFIANQLDDSYDNDIREYLLTVTIEPFVDTTTQAQKDEEQENTDWATFRELEEADKKAKWKQRGKPNFVPTP